jgi:hypothetical protein
MKYTDKYGDPVVIDTSLNHHVYITAETQVSLTPARVKAIRKQLKQWLIDNGHRKSKT